MAIDDLMNSRRRGAAGNIANVNRNTVPQEDLKMRKSRLAGALVIASMVAASLVVSAKPVSADTASFCAHLAAVAINIQNSMAPSFAKNLAMAAIYGTKKAAACVD